MNDIKPIKPIGHPAYGSIPHLPGSRRGPADKGLSDSQASILTVKKRDKHDMIYVQEKLDGSCVSVARMNGEIYPLIRAGYLALSSKYEQHHFFHGWAMQNRSRFLSLLKDGERACGEWLLQAHGTRYKLPHEPFVIFDIMTRHERKLVSEVEAESVWLGFITPRLIHAGDAISIADVVKQLEPSGHGAIDPVEGAVWRCERNGKVDFLGKYVRPEKEDGKYLESICGEIIYNIEPKEILK